MTSSAYSLNICKRGSTLLFIVVLNLTLSARPLEALGAVVLGKQLGPAAGPCSILTTAKPDFVCFAICALCAGVWGRCATASLHFIVDFAVKQQPEGNGMGSTKIGFWV